MKSVFFAMAVMFVTAGAFAQDGTKSVLASSPTVAEAGANSTPAQPTVGVVGALVASNQTTVTKTEPCEVAKLVKLAPWQVRRLNRVADRQEARDAKKCCCVEKSDRCKCACRRPPAVVVESR